MSSNHQNNIAASDGVKALEDIYLWVKRQINEKKGSEQIVVCKEPLFRSDDDDDDLLRFAHHLRGPARSGHSSCVRLAGREPLVHHFLGTLRKLKMCRITTAEGERLVEFSDSRNPFPHRCSCGNCSIRWSLHSLLARESWCVTGLSAGHAVNDVVHPDVSRGYEFNP
jgi:hypothetical protein